MKDEFEKSIKKVLGELNNPSIPLTNDQKAQLSQVVLNLANAFAIAASARFYGSSAASKE